MPHSLGESIYSLGEGTLDSPNSTDQTQPETDILPAQSAALIRVPSLEAQPPAQPNNGNQIRHSQRARGTIAHILEPLRQPGIRLLCLALGLLLSEVSFGAKGFGLGSGLLLSLLPLDPGSLRVGLDFLLGEIGGDGADRGGVNVDKGGGGGGVIDYDLGWLRGSSLKWLLASEAR